METESGGADPLFGTNKNHCEPALDKLLGNYLLTQSYQDHFSSASSPGFCCFLTLAKNKSCDR
jgi:hypothetical protein